MGKKCPRCDSTNVVKVVSAKAMVIPQVKEEVKQGLAIVDCGCHGTISGTEYKCKDCKLRWDDLMEEAILANRAGE